MRKFFLLLVFAMALAACKQHTATVDQVRYQNIKLDSTLKVSIDPKIEAQIKPYRDSLQAQMSQKLCVASEDLFAGRPESLLGNFVSDLVLSEGKVLCQKKYPDIHPVVSYMNRGGFRAPIPKGEVTVKSIFELMPFENEVVLLKLKGSDLRRLMNHMASRGGEGVAGMRLGIRKDKAIKCKVDGAPLDNDKTYWMITSDYLADGGDGSKSLSKNLQRVNTGVKLRDMIIAHMRKLGDEGKMATAKLDGRIYHAK
ncbi:5'-nucleotidase [Prolixibacter bellariivorans]|uniref:5'-nucleotidase n=1 Tax=Prolixibacter bellariivorans TaxID=314319 RepID=A0A5M4B0A0_9BACT|nr:5'-nucleotidase [Prolixibacter bellariivorans]GET33580.1 5'-nucleotidase [Prolixibacter bellariivorans]